MENTTQDNRITKTETLSVTGTRVFNSPEERASYCVQFFEKGLAPALEHISPILSDVFKDFSQLKRGGGMTIMGCSSQEEWSQRYFHRTARAIRYMIAGGNPGTHHGPKQVLADVHIQVRKTRELSAEGEREVKNVISDVVDSLRTEDRASADVTVLVNKLAPVKVDPKTEPIRLEPFKPLEEIQAEIPKPQEPKPVGPSVNDFRIQKLQSDLEAERATVQELKRLVTLVLQGEENLRFLPTEATALYDKLMR